MQSVLKSTKRLFKRFILRSTLNVMSYLRFGKAAGKKGHGVIMTLHRVEPAIHKSFQPNAHLTITPTFLQTLIEEAKALNMQPIAVCDIKKYIAAGHDKPFIAFTLDDGYKNNRGHAAEIFSKNDVPYTIFISKGFSERTHTLWWETAEQLFRKVDELELNINGQSHYLPTRTNADKHQAFSDFAQILLENPEDDAIRALDDAAENNGIFAHEIAANLIMDRTELQALNEDPLCHLAPHTVSHINLAHAAPERLKNEITESVAYVQELAGETPSSRVFSYPYGKPFATNEAVFQAALDACVKYGVVTSPGAVSPRTEPLDWMRLWRMSVNGHFQSRAAARSLLCGVPTLLEYKWASKHR